MKKQWVNISDIQGLTNFQQLEDNSTIRTRKDGNKESFFTCKFEIGEYEYTTTAKLVEPPTHGSYERPYFVDVTGLDL